MRYHLNEILDIPVLQKLMENFHDISGMVAAIVDLDGAILLAVGWQDICTKFHRVCPQTECRCRQSDQYLKEHLHEKPYIVYKCLNGLMDCAVPIIVDNHHLGTFFSGQFLPEPPNEEFFRQQARKFGFDESAYIDALRRVPIITEDNVEATMAFYSQLAQILSTMGLQRINQLKAEEAAARESEERLNLILESSNSGSWDWNLEIGAFCYSTSWHKMLGYSPNEISPTFQAWKSLIYNDDRPTVIKRISDHIQGITPQYEVEYRVLTKSGDYKWIQGRGKVVARDNNNRALRMIGIATDISKSKLAESVSKQERNLNAALLDNAGNLIIVCNQKGQILRFNQLCEQITGFSFNDVNGSYVWDMLAPEDMTYAKHLFDKPLINWDSPGLKRKFENHLLTKDSKRQLISWTTTFLVDELGSTNYVICSGTDITQQRIMEKRLRESEAELRIMFENVNGVIYSLSPDGRFTFVSPGWTELLGHEIAEVENHSFELFVHPDDIHQCRSFMGKIFDSGKPQKGVEYRVKHLDGTWRWHTSSGAAVKDMAGNPIYYVGIATDITERKQMEINLQESEIKFSKAFNSNPDSITISNIGEGNYVEVNDAFLQCFGYEHYEVIGHSTLELNIWLVPSERNHILNQIQATGKIYNYETKFRMKSGEIRTFLLSADIMDFGGKPHLLSVAKDITERKHIEEALQESERRFRETLENVKLVTAILDDKIRITFCNDFLLELLGWKREEVIGRDWFDIFVPPEVRERDRHIINKSLERRTAPTYGESEIMTKSGERKIVLWNNTILLNPDNSSAGFAIIGEDITERRAAETRSRELLQELESTNLELKDFAYIVSHDLKAPLRGIRSLADWLYADYIDKFDENGKQQLSMLMNRVDRMHKLLEGILSYSRISAKKELRKQVNLNEIISDVIEILAPPDNISIIIENEMPTLVLGQTRTEQIFENLISNSIKYMDKPHGEIRISCENQGSYWLFKIADNGPGIDAKYFDKIFTIFQTLKPRDEFESTGIGLTIVKKIVELYNGTVWVDSQLGEGTTFYFTLPSWAQ
ncbi:MAG: hypothetical protein CVU90_12725 [Firmicutes bacterium HGW-Firmicutes-15]|nr:MAG: hypothetical protein CVU90_12725 [Firmicutes bacterium HGW-Firmicutes-15]